MFFKQFIKVFILFTALESVFGATCTTSNNTCVETTNTLSTCTANVCVCKGSAVPIRTGCGTQFLQPSIKQDKGYTQQVLSGKSAVLTCSSSDSTTLFEWKLNGNIISGATGNTYTITSANSSSVGPYTCKAKASSSSNLDSPYSYPVSLTLIGPGDAITKPTLTLPTASIFAGKSVTLKCENIPIGYNSAKIVYKFDNSTIITSTITYTSADLSVKVLCSLTDTTLHSATNADSDPVTLPSIESDISSVAIENYASLNNKVFTTDESITLKCVPTPDVAYIDKDLTYAWLNDSVLITGATAQTYALQKADGTYTITCQANYTATAKTSSVLTITRNGAYLTKPVISADPTTPVTGTHLTLACGTLVADANYFWLKDYSIIEGEEEHKIQLDNLTSTDFGKYTCVAQRSMVILTSDTFGINAAQMIAKVSLLVLGLTLMMSKVLA